MHLKNNKPPNVTTSLSVAFVEGLVFFESCSRWLLPTGRLPPGRITCADAFDFESRNCC